MEYALIKTDYTPDVNSEIILKTKNLYHFKGWFDVDGKDFKLSIMEYPNGFIRPYSDYCFIDIFGTSGSGKSVTAKMIRNILSSHNKVILNDDCPISDKLFYEIDKKHVDLIKKVHVMVNGNRIKSVFEIENIIGKIIVIQTTNLIISARGQL